jgi:GLPGLI family protein
VLFFSSLVSINTEVASRDFLSKNRVVEKTEITLLKYKITHSNPKTNEIVFENTYWQYYNLNTNSMFGSVEAFFSPPTKDDKIDKLKRKMQELKEKGDPFHEVLASQIKRMELEQEKQITDLSDEQHKIMDHRTDFMKNSKQKHSFFALKADTLLEYRIGMESNERLAYSVPNFDWKITQNTQKFGDYTALEATTNYMGRTITAWFTTNIALIAGPYLFTKLPGTIVKLQIDDLMNYELLSIEKEEKMPKETKIFKQKTVSITLNDAVAKQLNYLNKYIQHLELQRKSFSSAMEGVEHTPEVQLILEKMKLNVNPEEYILEKTLVDGIRIDQ